jgi:heat shock protein HslJ
MTSKYSFLMMVGLIIISCNTTNQSTGTDQILDGHNSKNSLDWTGIYRGVIPCADCEGIQTEIRLNQDMTYMVSTRYLGKDSSIFSVNGSFEWDQSGNKITLANLDRDLKTNSYLVGEDRLFKLDMQRNKIEGDLSGQYILEKDQNNLTEKYWKLVELDGQPIAFGDHQQREAHLILKEEDSRVQGHSNCNSFSGTYELSEVHRIRFSPLASTKMACPDMNTESRLFQILEVTDNYSVNEDFLFLNKAKMSPLAKFEAVYFR